MQWFDLDHLGKSAAQFDEAKLRWVNAQHLKAMDDAALSTALTPFLTERGLSSVPAAQLQAACGLFKDRCETLVALADWVCAALQAPDLASLQSTADWQQHLAADKLTAIKPAIANLADKLQNCEWDAPTINAAFKASLQETGLKMPQLAMPVRVLTVGRAQTPSVDALLHLIGREQVLTRLASAQAL